MLPSPTDFAALLGIALVLSAVCFRVAGKCFGPGRRVQLITGVLFLLMWWPVGVAKLPLVAYVRGFSSDLSVTLVILAGLDVYQRVRGIRFVSADERQFVYTTVAVVALLLYPLALGWGDWDAYRLGWGSSAMLFALLVLCMACWIRGLRLLPLLVAAALLAWSADVLESGNLWDYLFDPWLAMACLFLCLKAGVLRLVKRFSSASSGGVNSST